MAKEVQSPALLLREPISVIATDDLVALFQELGEHVRRRVLSTKPLLSTWSVVVDYLRSKLEMADVENFRVMFLDTRNRLIADDLMQVGTVNHVPVFPRQIAKRALELGATAIIIAHNHPSGDPTPSTADVTMTKTLVATLKPLDIAVHDHIVIGRDGVTSLRTKGLM